VKLLKEVTEVTSGSFVSLSVIPFICATVMSAESFIDAVQLAILLDSASKNNKYSTTFAALKTAFVKYNRVNQVEVLVVNAGRHYSLLISTGAHD